MSNDRCLWCEKRKEGVWLGACPKCAAEIQKKGLPFGGLKFDGVTQEGAMKAWAMLGDPNLLSDKEVIENPPIITKDSYGVSGGPLMAQCPKCFYEARVDPNCEICHGKYDILWEDRFKYGNSDEKNNKNPGGRAGCDQAECSEE